MVLPELDGGLAGLLTALELKGLLGTITVFATGEFGRTPKINKQRAGRDHYPRAMFVLLGGGISPDDVAASFYHSPGIDAHKEYRTSTGRPVAIVRNGTIAKELFA